MSAFIQQQVRGLTSKAFLTATSVSLPDVKYTPNWSLGMSFPLASYRYVNTYQQCYFDFGKRGKLTLIVDDNENVLLEVAIFVRWGLIQ